MNKQKGFTILEMVVVIGIIAIIATIGLSSYTSVQKKAKDSRRMADVELIRAAVEQYRSNNNAYPPAVPYPSGNTGICDPTGCASGIYLQKLPVDPDKTQVYVYQYINSADYSVCALLYSGGTSSSGDCGTAAGTQSCNYCMGPYGEK